MEVNGTKRAMLAGVVSLLVVLVAVGVDSIAPTDSSLRSAGSERRHPPSRAAEGWPEPDGEPPLELLEPPSPAGTTRSERTAQPALEGSPAGPGERAVLRLVYFVEADQEFDPVAVELIETQAIALQAYWYEEFGGTFRLPADGVDVVYGDHPAAWYDTTPNGDNERWYRLMNIREEIQHKLGLTGDRTGTRVLTYPNARIDGRVGANRYEGAWMDGDDISCIAGTVATTPHAVDFPASCLGTVVHELGHVYGLGHEGEDADCMQFGFYDYVSASTLCEFSAASRLQVITDPRNAGWLDAEPGDRG